MHRNYYQESHPVCGYDSCPCRGVNFISSYQGRVDYCVDGERVLVSDDNGISSRATSEQIAKLGAYWLNEYAKYCIWHSESKLRFGDPFPSLSPFNAPYAMPASR